MTTLGTGSMPNLAKRPTAPLTPRALALTLGLLAASPAFAYIDPNAGGWMYQLLFPLIVMIGAVWAGLRTRIRLWWWRWKNRGTPPAPPDDPDRE